MLEKTVVYITNNRTIHVCLEIPDLLLVLKMRYFRGPMYNSLFYISLPIKHTIYASQIDTIIHNRAYLARYTQQLSAITAALYK